MIVQGFENSNYDEDVHEMIVNSRKKTHFHVIFNVRSGKLIIEEHPGLYEENLPPKQPLDIKFVEEKPVELTAKDVLLREIIENNDLIRYFQVTNDLTEAEREYVKQKLFL